LFWEKSTAGWWLISRTNRLKFRNKFIFDHWTLGLVRFWLSNSKIGYLWSFNYQNCSRLATRWFYWREGHIKVEPMCQCYPLSYPSTHSSSPSPVHAITWHPDKFYDFRTSFGVYRIYKYFSHKLFIMARQQDARNFMWVLRYGLNIHQI
jgi:hypothetical protein